MRLGLLLLVLTARAAGAVDASEESDKDRQAIDAARSQAGDCYRGNVAAALGLNGNITVRLTVARSGLVTGARLVKSRMGMPRYHDLCVVAVVKKLHLPPGVARSFQHTFEWKRLDFPFEPSPSPDLF